MVSPDLLPPLAISLGDPAGIGPEIITEAWTRRVELGLPAFAICGGENVLIAAARTRGIDLPTSRIDDIGQSRAVFDHALPVLSLGRAEPAGAALALASLTMAVELTCNGSASAIVTGPLAKSSIAKLDPGFIGQTEFCADACHAQREDAVMMLAGPSLRTVPLTVHCALAEVPARITQELILRRCRVIAAALRDDYGIKTPRIAIAGLNPHAGEDGRMGREEIEIIAPAITQLQAEGINATGPHPADTLFAPHKRVGYDVALAMYHDQALVPLKTLDFDCGVNVTLGLPIVRTSPDHGTAFDIAGKNIASPQAMIAAIRMAGEVATRRANG